MQMKRSSIPAVLVECGFLSNPGESLLLQGEDYQRSLAVCIAGGISAYYEKVDTHGLDGEAEATITPHGANIHQTG